MIEITITAISTIGVILQALISNSNKKRLDKIDSLEEKMTTKINDAILSREKTYLADFMADLEKGETKTQEQIKRAYEIKEQYNALGGDSYIDSQWDKLKSRNLL